MNARGSVLLGRCAGALLALCGCSLVDPKVGPNQTCADQAEAGSGGAGYGGTGTGYGTAGPGYGSSGSAQAMCAADAGSACDDCESRWCCQTRVACYADPVCNCADQAIGVCLGMAPSDAGPEDPSVVRCWNAFSATGHIAQRRAACQRAWCQQACAVP